MRTRKAAANAPAEKAKAVAAFLKRKKSNFKPSKQPNAVSKSNKKERTSGLKQNKLPSGPKRQRAKQPQRSKPKMTSGTASETVSMRTLSLRSV